MKKFKCQKWCYLTHLDVSLDQLVAGFVGQLGVERLLRVRLKKR